jgi:predicted DNA-binding protein
MAASKPVPVRIPAEMVKRIDALKDPLVPREAYVRALLDKALTVEERQALAKEDS